MVDKYDWGKACRFFPGFRDSPGVQRTAWALMDLYNDKVHCAFPTRETLSQQLGAAPETVSKWVGMMKEGGALGCAIASIVKGIEPQDQIEAMLASQMAAVHMATMTFARRLAHCETIPQQDSAERAFNKLAGPSRPRSKR